ncbi:MAG: transcription antitermination factor NusB [Hyphomonadaceae bacterium]|nr:transcription antitermination factor NusB [Hyphomonadaceae bacterium]
MNPRIAAADILSAITDEGRALDDALSATPSFSELEGRDRAFARAMVAAALRRLGGIDAILAQFLQKPLPEDAVLGRATLRIGAAQVLVLGTPAHAAVGETVAAANMRSKTRGFAKLMNAVLRLVAEQGPALLEAQPPGADLPAWLYTRWRAAYGAQAAEIARALREEPPLDLSVKDDAAGWATRLLGELSATGSVRLRAPSPVDELAGFETGAWWVQDAAAALPAKLLGDVRGLNVLDLCAAPGGKTLQLAAAGANVTAVDRDAKRLERLEQNLARTRLAAKVICADALKLNIREPFDAVLLDAPCTSTGTLRRHPDIAWLRRPDDVRTLSGLQSALLAKAAGFVKPGGRLIYAVCSLEPEEGPGVVAQALESGVWRREPVSNGELPAEFITPEGDMRTLPAHWPEIGGLDGFYASRLIRA